MEDKIVERNPFLRLGRSKSVTNSMLQEEARELYEATEYIIPGKEWAEWFTAKRLSGAQRKN